jgi:hypothetical protein
MVRYNTPYSPELPDDAGESICVPCYTRRHIINGSEKADRSIFLNDELVRKSAYLVEVMHGHDRCTIVFPDTTGYHGKGVDRGLQVGVTCALPGKKRMKSEYPVILDE